MTPETNGGSDDADVVIIGAGAAGLAAALWLAEHGARTIAVEARDRTGGRVRQEHVGSVEVPAELGAEFIHGDAPETSALLRDAGLTTIVTADESWVCAAAGELRRDNDAFTPDAIFAGVQKLTTDESVDAFLRRFADDPQQRATAQRARTFVEGFEAADPTLASVRSIAAEVSSGVDSTSTRPVGSYAPLFERLTQRCVRAGVDLRLRTVVERIGWTPDGVTLMARAPSGGTTMLRARCAIVTLPIGVLRASSGVAAAQFVPPLPPRKHAALNGLEMGRVVRVALAFRTPFWERIAGERYRNAAFFRCEDGAYTAFWTQLPLRGRTIVAWAGGPRAVALEAISRDERIARARDAFGEMLGERALTQREFEAGVTHDWSADPFAGGAYSYVAAGAESARTDLGTPLDGTLFFAGEATALDGQGGTVSGAFATGVRAAREAADAFAVTRRERSGS